jgi:hypothetical protein
VNYGNSKEEPDQDPEDHQEGQCRRERASYQRGRCNAEISDPEDEGLSGCEVHAHLGVGASACLRV